MTKYQICLEISGDFAMWARPDTGSTPTSYPIPTWSAAKGIFESIAFLKDGRAWINPKRVEICRRVGNSCEQIGYQKYTNNYRGPLQNNDAGAFQFSTIILSDVCYRLYADIENGSGVHLKHGDNPSHQLQAMFERRLAKGQCYKTPCLGWNEFVASYWGPLREGVTEKNDEIHLDLVSVLNQVFDKAIAGAYQPRYQRGSEAKIIKGEFVYA
ncbi:CRISPR-associated protein Cas5 [Methylophilus aquaticus]|uniref:CRISPR-associated protein Cas5 n=1 Tax=Methylophilus aquaticus TaxID=1971610 RepID=A0ABT9JXW5_9PROT|nr:CRISPR-associated protein Cas5 [Methylophilus aquaticus]MDP8568750.1 CRISPR-associated protein Cas5 [Methylophilus aquaticus]